MHIYIYIHQARHCRIQIWSHNNASKAPKNKNARCVFALAIKNATKMTGNSFKHFRLQETHFSDPDQHVL